MSEPTKGPYRLGSPTYLDAEIELWCATIYDCGANPVGCGYGSSKEQAEANAQLLAAAPELREALRGLIKESGEACPTCHNESWNTCPTCGVDDGTGRKISTGINPRPSPSVKSAIAALAKADGKETKNEHAK